MIIKVCGLKEAENILSISKLSIDMVGYNFYAPSPRYLDILTPTLPKHIQKVGVFVNASVDIIRQRVDTYGLDYAQLHGDEDLAFCADVASFIPVIKVCRVDETFDAMAISAFDFCDYLLFDTATKAYGGSGKKFNWEILHTFDIQIPFLLSGGIGPDDVNEIKQFSHPFFRGIDINSKFEISPGVKDVSLIGDFIEKLDSDIHTI